MLFASQAAATANVRTYQDEQLARSSLVALVDIWSVSIVVFDAKTGQPVSFNWEACWLAGLITRAAIMPSTGRRRPCMGYGRVSRRHPVSKHMRSTGIIAD